MWETSTKRLQRHVERSRKRFKSSDEQVMAVENLLSYIVTSHLSLVLKFVAYASVAVAYSNIVNHYHRYFTVIKLLIN